MCEDDLEPNKCTQEEVMNHIKGTLVYPKLAKENGVEGKVYVRFVITKSGEIANSKVLRGIGFGCDKAALKAVRSLPKWKPGTSFGKPVHVIYTIPVIFRLD